MKRRSVLDELEPYVPGKRITGGIKLSSNENPLGPAPRALEAIARVAGDVHRYPDGGTTDLRAALARRWNVSPEMIVVGNGSDEILVMIAGSVIEPGTNVVTGAHTFSQYTFAAKIFGGEVRTTPMPDGRFDLDAVAEAIDGDTRVVFLCSPNNPTGAIIARRELEGFLTRVRDDVLVVIDEAYGEYVESDDYPDTVALVARHANLVRLRTFSKIYGLAALRVGYGIAQPQLIEAFASLRQPFNVGTIAQAAATAALGDDGFVERTLELNRSEKQRLERYLDRIGLPRYPSEANFVCVDLSGARLSGADGDEPGEQTRAVIAALRDRRITIRPLASFGMPEWVRISIGTNAEMDALYEALEAILSPAPTG
ncbi:MAG: histidinol-phosphate transaminase [bacterium]